MMPIQPDNTPKAIYHNPCGVLLFIYFGPLEDAKIIKDTKCLVSPSGGNVLNWITCNKCLSVIDTSQLDVESLQEEKPKESINDDLNIQMQVLYGYSYIDVNNQHRFYMYQMEMERLRQEAINKRIQEGIKQYYYYNDPSKLFK